MTQLQRDDASAKDTQQPVNPTSSDAITKVNLCYCHFIALSLLGLAFLILRVQKINFSPKCSISGWDCQTQRSDISSSISPGSALSEAQLPIACSNTKAPVQAPQTKDGLCFQFKDKEATLQCKNSTCFRTVGS